MAKYKVGDKVRVREDLHRVGTTIHLGMYTYERKMVTISEISIGYYRIKEDGGRFCWTDEMFDGLASAEEVVEETKTVHMTTIEVLEWIKDNYSSGVYEKVFGRNYPLVKLLISGELSASEIVSKIEEYERKKKEEEKEIETEFKFALRIIEDNEASCNICVDEKIVDEYPSIGEISNYLKEYCLAHKGEGDFFCIIEKRCCVKNNKGDK